MEKQFPPTLTINDKKRDCTACRCTLKPGTVVLKTFTKKGKSSGYFCTQAGQQSYQVTMDHLGYWDPVFLKKCPTVFDPALLPHTPATEVPFNG